MTALHIIGSKMAKGPRSVQGCRKGIGAGAVCLRCRVAVTLAAAGVEEGSGALTEALTAWFWPYGALALISPCMWSVTGAFVSSRPLYGRLQEYKTFLMRGKGVASLYTACFCRL